MVQKITVNESDNKRIENSKLGKLIPYRLKETYENDNFIQNIRRNIIDNLIEYNNAENIDDIIEMMSKKLVDRDNEGNILAIDLILYCIISTKPDIFKDLNMKSVISLNDLKSIKGIDKTDINDVIEQIMLNIYQTSNSKEFCLYLSDFIIKQNNFKFFYLDIFVNKIFKEDMYDIKEDNHIELISSKAVPNNDIVAKDWFELKSLRQIYKETHITYSDGSNPKIFMEKNGFFNPNPLYTSLTHESYRNIEHNISEEDSLNALFNGYDNNTIQKYTRINAYNKEIEINDEDIYFQNIFDEINNEDRDETIQLYKNDIEINKDVRLSIIYHKNEDLIVNEENNYFDNDVLNEEDFYRVGLPTGKRKKVNHPLKLENYYDKIELNLSHDDQYLTYLINPPVAIVNQTTMVGGIIKNNMGSLNKHNGLNHTDGLFYNNKLKSYNEFSKEKFSYNNWYMYPHDNELLIGRLPEINNEGKYNIKETPELIYNWEDVFNYIPCVRPPIPPYIDNSFILNDNEHRGGNPFSDDYEIDINYKQPTDNKDNIYIDDDTNEYKIYNLKDWYESYAQRLFMDLIYVNSETMNFNF